MPSNVELASAPRPIVLELSAVRKCYGGVVAVDEVSFVVRQGEVVGLLGPNGAGKTTSISMILGVLEPSSGTVRISGIDVATRRSSALAQTNFAASYAPLPGNLTVEENLKVFARLYGVSDIQRRIEALLLDFNLEKYRRTKAGVLSSGEQSRLSLAKAVLNQPRLLLLDEPTASLDPAVAQDIRGAIRSYATDSSAAVLWTSHNMFEVESVCDRVMIMAKGRILLEGDPRSLPSQHGKKNLEDLFISVAREPLESLGGRA